MTNFVKRLICILCVIVTISGLILFIFGAEDFLKISFSEPMNINSLDTSKFTENTLVTGNVYYVIDSIASSYIEDNTFNYYLVPIKSEKYIIVATNDVTIINAFNNIFEQTCQYLNGEIEDTSTHITIEGKFFPLDIELKKILYSWNDTTNYFSITDIPIDEQVLPYVVYTQDWDNIQTLSIIAIVTILIGIVGFIVSVTFLKC